MSVNGANYGRKVIFTWDGEIIDGVREKNVSLNGEPANITTDEDDGWQLLLDEDAERSVEISISGILKSDRLKLAKFSGNVQADASIVYPNGFTIAGFFSLSNYSEGMPYNDAITFEATLMSSGEIQVTAGTTT